MADTILDFRSENWTLVHSLEYRTEGFDGRRPIPIKPDRINVSLEARNLIVYCDAISTRSRYWIRGCLISQVPPISLGASYLREVVTQTELIRLRLPTLVTFSKFSVPYELRIDFFPWFEDVYVEIWAHIGFESDTTTESLLAIQNTLNQIMSRLP